MEIRTGYEPASGVNLWVTRFIDPHLEPSGLTILLLHGFMDVGASWDLVAETLTRSGHELVAPDFRGFGRSDRVGSGGYYHFPDYVADLMALVEHIAPQRLAIVGHSMGGTVASMLAGLLGDRVERLALLEGLGPPATPPEDNIHRFRAWLRDLKRIDRKPRALSSLSDAISRLERMHPSVDRAVLTSRALLLTSTDDEGRLSWAYDPLHRTTSPVGFSVEAFKSFLSAITCETLVVSGGKAGWHLPDEAERMACIMRTKFADLEGAGHMMHWTQPEAVAETLLSFLDSSQPRTRDPSG